MKWWQFMGRRAEAPAVTLSPPLTAPPARGAERALVLLAVLGALYLARSFCMPVALGLLIALLLSPLVQWLKRFHIPPAAGSAIVLIAFLSLLGGFVYLLAGPASVWVRKGPQIAHRISTRLEKISRPAQEFRSALSSEEPAEDGSAKGTPQLKPSAVAGPLVSGTGAFIGLAGTTFILVYFLLAAGDPLLASILAAIPDEERRDAVVSIGLEVKRVVSRYLLAITGINIGEGLLITLGLWLAGMPTPPLWGAIHALFNFIPYLGAITGLILTTLASFASFDSIPRALAAPAIYFSVMVLDNFATPMLLGKRLVLNPVLVFLSLTFWGWLWGIVGIFVAIPLLILFKVICDHVPGWKRFSRIITSSNSGEVGSQHQRFC